MRPLAAVAGDEAQYARMKLWTKDPLVAVRHIYLSRGFTLVKQDPHHGFGVDLVGQVYEVDLRPAAGETTTHPAASTATHGG
jgi:hypothetical protein